MQGLFPSAHRKTTKKGIIIAQRALRPEADDRIAAYRPADGRGWTEQTAQLVRNLVAATRPTSARDAHRLAAITAAFVIWGNEQDIPLVAEQLLTPERLDEYLASGDRAQWVHGTQIGVRWALRRVGIANTRRAPWRSRTITPGSKTVSFPYTPKEIRLYLDAAAKQRTPTRSRYMQAALAFHHGPGCTRSSWCTCADATSRPATVTTSCT